VGCASESPRQECASIDPQCTPTYEPTFDAIFDNTIKPGCARVGGTCHGSTTKVNTLIMEDREKAYRGLMQHVHAGDAACSPLVVRITASEPLVRMPPASALLPGEQCAIERWIAAGAMR